MIAAPNLAPLMVRPGQAITADLWNRREEFIALLLDNLAEMTGPGLKMDRHATGFAFRAERSTASFIGAFDVSILGGEATIGHGMIDGITPRIGGQLIYDPANPGKVPRLKLSPGEGSRSFIVLIAAPQGDEGGLDPDDESAAVIEHRSVLQAEADDPRAAVKALAVIEWAGNAATARQIVFFNQRLGSEDGRAVILPAA